MNPSLDSFLFAVIPQLIGPLQALLGLLGPILLGLAAFLTTVFSVQTWRMRTLKVAQTAARHKLIMAMLFLGLVAVSLGGWKLYQIGVEAGAKAGQPNSSPVQPPKPPVTAPSLPEVGSGSHPPENVSLPVPPSPMPVALLVPPRLLWKISQTNADYAPSPTVEGNRVYLAGAEFNLLGGRSGFVVCTNAEEGRKEIWRFKTEHEVFSSPLLAQNCLLVGEGLHSDQQASLYCLDSLSGQLKWKFPVKSHIESSPLVCDGKVYFGAGDAGVYCVELESGREIWHRGGWHVDSRGALANGKLVVGSGYDPLTIAGLDAATGKVLWEYTPEISAWGEPRIVGGRVIIGIGNGTYDHAAQSPMGAVLALDLTNGKEIWRTNMPDAILGAVAIEDGRGYIGCRDQNFYALDLSEGTILWKKWIGAPVLSTATLVNGMVYFGANDGQIHAVRAADGASLWTFNTRPFARFGAQILSSPAIRDGRLFVGVSAGCFLALTDLGSL